MRYLVWYSMQDKAMLPTIVDNALFKTKKEAASGSGKDKVTPETYSQAVKDLK